jgi:hypothetical protein
MPAFEDVINLGGRGAGNPTQRYGTFQNAGAGCTLTAARGSGFGVMCFRWGGKYV